MRNQKGDSIFWVVVIVALVAYGLWTMKREAPATSNTPVSNSNSQPISINTPAEGGTLSYAEAIAEYGGARIQLDANCQASPSSMTFKNNVYIMIDNRAGVERKVSLGAVSAAVPAYGFKIVLVSSPSVPAKLYLNCGSSKNVAAILIQS